MLWVEGMAAKLGPYWAEKKAAGLAAGSAGAMAVERVS